MKNSLRSIFALLLVAGMALSAVSCATESSTVGDFSRDDTATVAGMIESNSASSSSDEKDVTFLIDVPEQTSDKWKMTYKGCQINNKLDPYTIAEDGREFIVVFFEIENISEETQNFSIVWEEFYIDDIKTAQTIYGLSINGSFQLTAIPLEPGKKANGYFLLQTLPDWKKLEIIYDESLHNENDENVMKFTLTQNAK